MADQAGFARLWHELYDRLDTGRVEDAQKMAAAWLLVKTRDFKTGEFTLGPRYLEKRFHLSHGAAGRLIQMVAETEKRLGQNRANAEPAPGHDSLGAGESQAASGPAPGHDRANGGPIYRRVDVDGRKELSPSESVAANGDDGARAQRIDYQRYADAWNYVADQCGWPKVLKLSETRKRQLRARLKDDAFDWKAILEAARASQGLRGQQWFGFDWLIRNDEHYLRVLEGKYKQAFGAQNEESYNSGPNKREIIA